MPIKLSQITPADAGELPSGSWIATAIPVGDGSTFTLRRANPNQIGATGPQGTAGSTILSGAGAPAVALGANGDYYMDTANGNFYNKLANVWNYIMNLMGPTGAAGADGADGAVGPVGPAGPAGADGDDASPGGADTQIQYNDGGSAFNGSANLTYSSATGLTYAKNIAAAHSTLTYGANVVADFAGDAMKTVTLAGDIAFTSTNRSAGRSVNIRIVCDGTGRNLSFSASWKFVGAKPTTIAASKVGRLSLECYGANETDVVAAYCVEA